MTGPADQIRVNGRFAQFSGRRFSCVVGRGGIRPVKREGDGATPAGDFGLLGILCRRDRVKWRQLPGARPIRRFDVWSDDPGDPRYNQFVASGHPYPWSHERLWRSDRMYDVVIPVAYNWPDPEPGAGSAIFVHIWRGPRQPTEGCVAFSRKDLMWIAARISRRTRLVVLEPGRRSAGV